MLRFLTAGESHGPGLVTIVEGLPRGLEFSANDLSAELSRRRLGYGRGGRMKVERDEVEVIGGIRHGRTLGSPVAVVVRNSEAEKWSRPMSIEPVDDPVARVTRPRPGHADLAGMIKYGTDDARDVLERASARETAARTVAGFLAKAMLSQVGVEVRSHVVSIGSVTARGKWSGLEDFAGIDDDPVRCLDKSASQEMVRLIDDVTERKDTLGGTFEVLAFDVPIGLGSYVHYDRRLDGALAGAIMSIPAIKGVEIGDGFEVASAPGSLAHDEIVRKGGAKGRATNRAGGLEGGVSNGETLRVRAAMKPISTLMRPLQTIDMDSGEDAVAVRERSDVCAVPAAAVVGEQMVAWVLAAETVVKFGGDTIEELAGSVSAHRKRVDDRLDR
ncbi:MAG: chorismate synthase [Actinobacteria bacterium]|nr:MAG: chorismate synthase [Actinomycetota bacterium]